MLIMNTYTKIKTSKGFGSYGDILIRDRKMYVVPTPFHLVEGVAHRQTLILPADTKTGKAISSRWGSYAAAKLPS